VLMIDFWESVMYNRIDKKNFILDILNLLKKHSSINTLLNNGYPLEFTIYPSKQANENRLKWIKIFLMRTLNS